MPDESRHNPFNAAHKAMRLGHCRMIGELGAQDFSDEPVSARLMLRLHQHLDLNRAMAVAQHEALLPDLMRLRLDAAASQQQASHLAALAELDSLLRAFAVATPQRRGAAGSTLYRCYALFAASDMARMDCEETTLLANLHAALADDDLRAMEGRSLKRLPPDQLDRLLHLALPALAAAELETLLDGLRQVIEPARFAALFETTVQPLLAANSAAAA